MPKIIAVSDVELPLVEKTDRDEAISKAVEVTLKGEEVVLVGANAWELYREVVERVKARTGNFFLIDAIDPREAKLAKSSPTSFFMARIAYTTRRSAKQAETIISASKEISRRSLLKMNIDGILEYGEYAVPDQILCSKPSIKDYCKWCLESCNGCAASAALCGVELLHTPGYSRKGLHELLRILEARGPGYIVFTPRSVMENLVKQLARREYEYPIILVPVSCPYVVGLEELLAVTALGFRPVIVEAGWETSIPGCRGSREVYEEYIETDYVRITGRRILYNVEETVKHVSEEPDLKTVEGYEQLLARGLRPLALAYLKNQGIATRISSGFAGVVAVDQSKCTVCGACVNLCPTKALEVIELKDNLVSLVFKHDRCIACGNCVKSCPENALRLTNSVNASIIDKYIPLTVQEQVKCIVCGKPIGSVSMVEKIIVKLLEKGINVEENPSILMCVECKQKYVLGLISRDSINYTYFKSFVSRVKSKLRSQRGV